MYSLLRGSVEGREVELENRVTVRPRLIYLAIKKLIYPSPKQNVSSTPTISTPTYTMRTRTRTNTNPNGTEANAAGRSGNARALRKQSKCGMIQEGTVLEICHKSSLDRPLSSARVPTKA